MNFTTSDAATLFRSFTTITSLELNNIKGVELLTALDEDGTPLWPHLHTLRCGSGFWRLEENCAWLEKLLGSRARLTLEVPVERKDEVLAISGIHDVRFVSDEFSGLIRAEDFVPAKSEEKDEEDDEEEWPSGGVEFDDSEDDDWDTDAED